MKDAIDLLESSDRELWIVTARAGRRTGGLVATFVNSASIVAEMPRVVVGLARQHRTWELVEASKAFALHLLDAAHVDWVWRFGLQSGRDTDKLDGLAWRAGVTGSPILDEALAWLDCRVECQMSTGDRTLYVAEVLDASAGLTAPPLTVTRMLELATPDQRDEMKRQRSEDAAVDAEAIRLWRRDSASSQLR